jgi:hypothetical protein
MPEVEPRARRAVADATRGECSAPADGAARGWRHAPSIYTEGPTFSFFSFFCNRQS